MRDNQLCHQREPRPIELPRRDFLKCSALTATATVLAREFSHGGETAGAKSKVVVVTSDSAIREDNPDRANPAVLEKMLERGLCELAAKSDVKQAWQTWFRSSDSVATCDAGFHLQNVPEVTVATLKGLAFAGVARMKLGSQYVTLSQQRPALAARSTPWIAAVKEGLKAASISEEVIDPALYNIPARYAVESFDAVLLVCTLKPHYLCGVAGAVKHFATLSKKGPSVYHPDAMVTAGSVLATDFKEHRKLVVVDALRFPKTGDPHRPARDYVFTKSLVLSADPVAADTVALDMFLKSGCKPHGDVPPRVHIEAADKQYHVGVSDLAAIEMRQIRL